MSSVDYSTVASRYPKLGSSVASPLLALSEVAKRFGGVQALDGACMTVSRPGVVHALAGENGSGKSTMLRILSGQIRADSGIVALAGEPVAFDEPADALKAGIAMVSQETSVAGNLSVAENVLLGHLVRGRRGVDWPATHRRAADILARLELDYDTRWLVGRMRPDQRQLIEIARAMSTDVRVLILDEPTSSLTDDEVEGLFKAVGQLKRNGMATLFVSHRLDEVFSLSDEITVLRDGSTVAGGAISKFTKESLVTLMIGHAPATASERDRPGGARPGEAEPALTLQAVSVTGTLRDIDLDIFPGEIVGVAGLVGAGRSELLETIFGLRNPDGGQMRRSGRPFTPTNPQSAVAQGVGYLPPERRTQGVVLSMSVGDNLTMVETAKDWRLRRPSGNAARAAFANACKSVGLRAPSRRVLVGTLSGGNQQKVAIAKWLEVKPSVLLLDEPTRGVDVGAKDEIHAHLKAAAARGMAQLVSSSDNTELLDLCDRIVVMFRGRIVASLPRREATEAALTRIAGGEA